MSATVLAATDTGNRGLTVTLFVVLVAVTLYIATNESGRLKMSVMLPAAPALTVTSRRQVCPMSSFTKMCTFSPKPQPELVRITVEPGA